MPKRRRSPRRSSRAWDALVHRARVSTGDRVLIHAVGSGVGTAAVQLSRFLGVRSVGTSRTAAKLDRVMEMGLDEAIDTSTGSFLPRLGEKVHALIDCLGGPVLMENLNALLPRGRLVLIGHLLGGHGEIDLGVVLRQRLEIIGTVMRSRAPVERATLAREFTQEVLPAFAISAGGEGPRLPAGRRCGPADDETGTGARVDGEERYVREGDIDLELIEPMRG